MANNPSLTLLMVATLKGFPFKWDMSADKLSVVSVGTGYSVFKKKVGEIEEAWLATWAQSVPEMLMQDASWQNQVVLQWLSQSPTANYMDAEMGTLKDDFIGGKPLIKYLRYNLPITEKDLNLLGLKKEFNHTDVASLIDMSNADNRELLYQLGEAASSKIEKSHFD